MDHIPPEYVLTHACIIDNILAASDLSTISAKAVRKTLQLQLGYQLPFRKEAVNQLIMHRFDVMTNGSNAAPLPNSLEISNPPANSSATATAPFSPPTTSSPSQKRSLDHTKSSDERSKKRVKKTAPPSVSDADHLFLANSTCSPLNDTTVPVTGSDGQIPAPLKVEEDQKNIHTTYAAARATTESTSTPPTTNTKRKPKSSPVVKNMSKRPSKNKTTKHTAATATTDTETSPKKNKKKKSVNSSSKNMDDDDDGLGDDQQQTPQKEVTRTGGFHKPMVLSESLSNLLGITTLSRPQTVKKIWEYIRSNQLQDESDRRQICCDEPMRAVFKQERIHMFTMTKILNQNLYSPEEC